MKGGGSPLVFSLSHAAVGKHHVRGEGVLALKHHPSPAWNAGKWPSSRPVTLTSLVSSPPPHTHTPQPASVIYNAMSEQRFTTLGIQLCYLGAWGVEKGHREAERVRAVLQETLPLSSVSLDDGTIRFSQVLSPSLLFFLPSGKATKGLKMWQPSSAQEKSDVEPSSIHMACALSIPDEKARSQLR